MNGEISKEGITKDLEHMARVGISRAMIGNIENTTPGGIDTLSKEWEELTKFAIKEATRLGIEIFMFNSPGWSQSGGPWVTEERSMRYVDWKILSAQSGNLSVQLRDAKRAASQDIAVLAVRSKDVTKVEGQNNWVDAAAIYQSGKGPSGEDAKAANSSDSPVELLFEKDRPFTARGLEIWGKARGKLYVEENGQRKLLADIDAKGGDRRTDIVPNDVETFSFPDAVGKRFILSVNQPVRAMLSSAPTVAQVTEKQLRRMFFSNVPPWDSYIFPKTVEPEDQGMVINKQDVFILTDSLNEKGTLELSLPDGKWDIYYFFMKPTGKTNVPAAKSATGLEIDKMNSEHVAFHFDAFIGKIYNSLSQEERKSFVGITADSYEVGAQNWTDNFDKVFAREHGYDPIPFLLSMTGRVVDSAAASDQFLWDLRRTIADTIAREYVGGLRKKAHELDLTLWLENYGHWGFPGDYLVYGGYSDEIGGEFWLGNMGKRLGRPECRAASSSAANYGKNRVYAEAYTSLIDFNSHPYTFKARGEELFSLGINHFVLHVYIHQAKDGVPGKNSGFGTPLHRNTPWFKEARDWIKYLERTHLMLQQGTPAAEVAIYSGDFAPQMIGPSQTVPDNYNFDYLGSDALLRTVDVVDGDWVVYSKEDPNKILVRWELLVIPEDCGYVRPQVLARIEELKAKGGCTVTGLPVRHQTLAKYGIEKAVFDATTTHYWDQRHLENGEIFYLNNFRKTGEFSVTLRSFGKLPELFNPVTGEVRKLARYQAVEGGTRVSFDVKDRADAFFIVFREIPPGPSVVDASADASILDLYYNETDRLVAETSKTGEYEIRFSDQSSKTIRIERAGERIPLDGEWKVSPHDQEGFSERREVPFTWDRPIAKNQRVWLDLEQVNVMAAVTINGQVFRDLWMPPYRLDITDAIKVGKNELSIIVTSTSKSSPSLSHNISLEVRSRKQVK